MDNLTSNAGLNLANELVAAGKSSFTFGDAQAFLGKSATASANVLKRMMTAGIVDRVRRGHYVVRPLGVLGTPAAAEDIALAVGSAFTDVVHRIAYRSALEDHDLISHPARTIQVAVSKRIRTKELSGRALRVILEPKHHIDIGAEPRGNSQVSSLERALLDAASRPNLVGGMEVLAEALAAAAGYADTAKLQQYAEQLKGSAALRRIASISDALNLKGLSGALTPIGPITVDLDFEPGTTEESVWRDSRWRLRWTRSIDEIRAITEQ